MYIEIMKDFYLHICVKNQVIMSTLPDDLLEEADLSSFGFTYGLCIVRKINKRYRKEAIQDGYIYMCSYDKSITNKIFSYYFDMLLSIHSAYQERLISIENELTKELRRLQHNVNTYNATIQDEIMNLVPLDDIHDNWRGVVSFVEGIIKNNTRLAAITLLKVIKFSTFITAEMTVYDYINAEQIKLETYPHYIHKIIKLSLQPYFLEFVENSIDINMSACYERVLVDYPSITIILGHLWNNTIKYIHPSSTIDISFQTKDKQLKININMLSLKIEKDEIYSIFEEGRSGKWAKMVSKNGHGIGMYYIKRLVELNGGCFEVLAGNNVLKADGIPYGYNEFTITLPLYIE